MWVKFCANTNLEDAALAAELGADAVGFVFAPSVRQVTAAQVARITPYLPETVELVGVFPACDPETIVSTVREAGLTAVQLHGGVDGGLTQALLERFQGQVRIIQTVHWAVADASSAASVAETIASLDQEGLVDRVLVDSKVGSEGGGTGVAFDWGAALEVFNRARGLKLILAGGLNPENVGAAIAQLRPWGVDVASGVERSPGRKDAAKMERLIHIAKADRTAP